MPKIDSIALKNFKGAQDVTIDLGKRGPSPVITLVGLNESGKTTILEGISHFVTGDAVVSSLFDGVHSRSEIDALIPVNRKAAFTGIVSITAEIALDDADIDEFHKLASSFSLKVDKDTLPSKVVATKQYSFEDSVYKGTTNSWTLEILTRSNRSKGAFSRLKQPALIEGKRPPNLWSSIVAKISATLPRIAYFPTFLVDMPHKIYLSQYKDEKPVNRYYRRVFQDILDTLNEGLTLEKHVVKRILDFKSEANNPSWLSILLGGPSKAPIDSVFQKISSAVTKEVLGSWQRVFQRKISAKNIHVEWGIDAQKDDLPYASFSISDGESRYAISERSLGFRWFFSFLLFTAFKQQSDRSTIFVFDEPAANLHAKAQAELLTSFERTVSDGNQIIYSTHSHHMISPHWLSGAYIVENTALDYDSDEDTFGLSSKPTNVRATPYRHFVSQYPARTSYFQPVVDMLEYVTPEIIGNAPFVMVEGITDFYALKLAIRIAAMKVSFSILPGIGAAACGPQIASLLGRGDRFVVVLDDDKAGREAAAAYREDWFLDAETAFTLSKIHRSFEGKKLEDLLTKDTLDLISRVQGLTKRPSKKQIGLYLAEMCAISADADCLSNGGLENLKILLTGLESQVTRAGLGISS